MHRSDEAIVLLETLVPYADDWVEQTFTVLVRTLILQATDKSLDAKRNFAEAKRMLEDNLPRIAIATDGEEILLLFREAARLLEADRETVFESEKVR